MKKKVKNLAKKYSILLVLFFILTALSLLTFEVIFQDKFFPQTYLGDTNITFLTKAQAKRVTDAKFNQRASGQVLNIDLATASAMLDYSAMDESFKIGHQGSLAQRLAEQLKTFFSPLKIRPQVYLNLDQQLQEIALATYQPPQDAQLTFSEVSQDSSPSAQIQIKEAEEGQALDREGLLTAIENYLLFGQTTNQLPVKMIPPKITTEHVQRAKEALESSLTEPVTLVFEGKVWELDTKQLLTILDLTSGSDLLLDKGKTYSYLQKMALEIDQEVQEGYFQFNPQEKRVTAFKASQEGRKLDLEKTYQLITSSLQGEVSRNISLPVEVVKPKIQTQDVNSLGIKELLGRGISHFAGSIPNRIYNISLTASRINGVLIPPGEIFSFNQTVGDITAATGYKQAYVIKEGRTVLDDGGGVCQDSTTLFRAVLNAGLPVIKRTAHAYRVGYYEQGFSVGLDATVFYPSVDFQFKNDTPAHILIQAYTQGLTLYIDLYGTPDGRVTTLTKSVVTNQTPPPPEVRQDDPSLPKGEVKQVDWAAWGADVSFKRAVERGGETIISETWNSHYKPWQAVYLVGTKE